jgi:hypothetical protein
MFVTIAMVLLLREFDTAAQTKANLFYMLSGIASFAVEIVDIRATGRCIRSWIFALITFRIFIQFLFVFSIF